MTTDMQRRQIAAAMSEDDLLSNVVALAEHLNFAVHHCRPAWTAKGWRTPVQGSVGFPDVLCVGHGWVLAVECKAERARLTTSQEQWRQAFEQVAAAPGSRVRYVLWRPTDLLDGTIRSILTAPSAHVP